MLRYTHQVPRALEAGGDVAQLGGDRHCRDLRNAGAPGDFRGALIGLPEVRAILL